MQKVLVLGAEGMLGNYVFKYLKTLGDKFEVLFCPHMKNLTTIKGIDARWGHSLIKEILRNEFELVKDDVVVNCIGIINKNVETIGIYDTIVVNSLFPHILSKICKEYEYHFIHISTDCVFSGMKGNYSELDKHDATDIYGKTKSLGEPSDCTLIRTSIIGEEKRNKTSIIEWLKSKAGKSVDGYVNHKWNGITCLRLAQGISGIILENAYWQGVKHVHGQSVNKHLLCSMINKAYNLNLSIYHKETEICDRTLTSVRKEISLFIPDLYQDILKQKEFGL